MFNGDIYNFVELREELEVFGHIFKMRPTIEVIVHAYEQWGRDCVRRFNGMFALASWDGLNCELFIARYSTWGFKPLYYVDLGSHVFVRFRDQGTARGYELSASRRHRGALLTRSPSGTCPLLKRCSRMFASCPWVTQHHARVGGGSSCVGSGRGLEVEHTPAPPED